jgi:Domain of unknown function (DUF4912)
MLKNQDAPVLALAALLMAIAPAISAGFTLPETVPQAIPESNRIVPNQEIEAGNLKAPAPSLGNPAPIAPKTELDTTKAITPAQKPGFPWLLWFLPLLGLPLLGWWLLGLLDRDDRSVADPLLDDRAAVMPELEGVPPMASGTIALGPVTPNNTAMTPLLSHPPIHYAGQANPGQACSMDAIAREASSPNGCRLVIMPRVPKRAVMGLPQNNEPRAYVYWDLPMPVRQTAQAQGGQQLVLRVYDATNIDLDHQAAHSFRQYPIADDDRDRVLSVPQGDRDYVAEIGYLTAEGRMLSLVRSTYAHVPMRDSVSL